MQSRARRRHLNGRIVAAYHRPAADPARLFLDQFRPAWEKPGRIHRERLELVHVKSQCLHIMLFMFVEFYIFAAIGSILFHEINPLHWGNVGMAMLTLFQTATLEGWPDLMYQSLETQRYSWIFFVVFIIINALIFMNMIIGVIIDVIIESNEEETPEIIRLLNEIKIKIDEIETRLDK